MCLKVNITENIIISNSYKYKLLNTIILLLIISLVKKTYTYLINDANKYMQPIYKRGVNNILRNL